MPNWSLYSQNWSQTRELGRVLGALMVTEFSEGNLAVALVGGLGVGKTAFAQGVGIGAQVEDDVTSPTFALMNEYNGVVPILHCDTYRLEEWELDGIGLEETLEEWPGICLVEWADRFSWVMPEDAVWVTMTVEGAGRRFSIAATGERHQVLLDRWQALWQAEGRG